MPKKSLSLIPILLLLASMLSACGFTLRTQNSLPPQLRTIYFQAEAPYGQMEMELKKELKATGVKLLDDAQTAPFILHVAASSFNHATDTSNGPSTQARIYHLTMTTSFFISNQQGHIVLEPQTISSTQDLTLNANEIFDTSTQVDVAKENMQHNIITKIFDRLCSQKTFSVLK